MVSVRRWRPGDACGVICPSGSVLRGQRAAGRERAVLSTHRRVLQAPLAVHERLFMSRAKAPRVGLSSRDAVNPSLEAAGKTSMFCTPRNDKPHPRSLRWTRRAVHEHRTASAGRRAYGLVLDVDSEIRQPCAVIRGRAVCACFAPRSGAFMNATSASARASGGRSLSRSVRNRDVSPAASMDGFTAFRERLLPSGARARDEPDRS